MAMNSMKTWIQSFDGNRNPAIITEILTGIQILFDSGLDSLKHILPNYRLKGWKKLPLSITNDCVGIVNVTQDDAVGGTGDIGIVRKNGKIDYYSITKLSKNKCIHNPSAVTYNINKDAYKKDVDEAIALGVKYLEDTISPKPCMGWKRQQNPHAKSICSMIAKEAEKGWNTYDKETRKGLIKKMLDLDDEKTNTKGIIYTDEKGIKDVFDWKLKISLEDCLEVISDGIYIYHCVDRGDFKNTWFLKTQIKFNNGIIELPSRKSNIPEKEWTYKKGDLFGSWNCVANVDAIFDMKHIYSNKKRLLVD